MTRQLMMKQKGRGDMVVMVVKVQGRNEGVV
jgi:hypothetical protein